MGIYFLWYNKIKSLSLFIVGISLEFDFVMYIVCFFVCCDVDCRFLMVGYNMDIKSYIVLFGIYYDFVVMVYIN